MRSTIRDKLFALVILALSTFGFLSGCSNTGPKESKRLLYGADPHMAYLNELYWIYRTSPISETDQVLNVYISEDMTNWIAKGPILKMSDISWANRDGAPRHYLWAPAIAHANDEYYLYFSLGPQNPTPSRIGVAVADNPGGPFRDTGKPLLTGGDGFEAIDPMVFFDPFSGKPYLYAGGSAGAILRIFELKENMVELEREIEIEQPEHFTEAPFMHFHNGTYYLTYSKGRWNDNTYSVHYSVSQSPVGPWAYKGILISSNEKFKGPGHSSFVNDPNDDSKWYFVYHRWDGSYQKAPYEGDYRHIVIHEFDFDSKP